MGKTKKLYLTRRILAMILAAAMTVTMIPQTALAAPADDAEGIVSVAAEENSTAADGAVADETEVEGTDEVTTPEDNKVEDEVTTGGENTVVNDDTPAAQYEIVLDYTFQTKVEYDGSTPFADIMDYVSLKKDGETLSAAEAAKITVAWKQKGADDTYAAITDAPKNAGSYQAVLTYPEQAGVEKTVNCEITKAPVTITVTNNSRTVKPGTKKSAIQVPEIDRVRGGKNEIDDTDITLTMVDIKNALTGAKLEADDVLVKGTDYVMELTPTLKDTVTDDSKKNNYDLKPFTVDIAMQTLIYTQVTVTLADKWKQEGQTAATQITKEYDGNAISDPEAGTNKDYDVVVEYRDTDGTYKKLDGAETETVGEWETYPGCELDENGKVMAPVNAGTYYYKVAYPGKDGVYAESRAYSIRVEITPMELTIEATNAAPLSVPENITVREMLAKITYKVLNKAGEGVTEDVKAKHIWGTSYSDRSESQIYEPLFTVQESSDSTTWTDIYDMDATLQKDATTKYRVAFTGRKAVLNASGSIANIVDDINDNTYYDDYYNLTFSINGVDSNYHTNTANAEGKELAVEVKAGTKAKINVDGLLGEQKGALEIKDLKPKQYDGAAIFTAASQYKNQVKLTTEDGTTEITTEQREFTYTWSKGYKYEGYQYLYDLIDAKIAEQNGTFGSWRWNSYTGTSLRNAGVYRLTISYEDKIDPDTYNYADDVTIYFAIDPRKVTVTPKEDSFEVLDGSSVYDFFRGEKEIEYTVTADEGTLPNEDIVPHGLIVKETPVEPPVEIERYYQSDYDYDRDYYGTSFEKNAAFEYVLAGSEIGYYSNGSYYENKNYTCWTSELKEADKEADGVAKREDILEYKASKITVVPMGTEQLTITVDSTKWTAPTKPYDAKPFTVADGLVTVKKADGTVVTDLELKYVVHWVDDYGNDTDTDLKDVVDAGSYDLYVRFDGDKTYAPVGWDDNKTYPDNLGLKIGTFKITPIEIALTADLDETYTAGTTVDDVLDIVNERYKVTGYVPGQEEAFKNYWGYSDAWNGSPSFYVVEEGTNTRVYDNLERNKSYEVRYDRDNSYLKDRCGLDTVNKVPINAATDYTVKNAPVAAFGTVPGNSTIVSVDYSSISKVEIQTKNDAADPMKREVTMTEAIGWARYTLPYSYNYKVLEGNLIAFRFDAPAEYGSTLPPTAMYQNEIEAKGGYVVSSSTYNGYFTAVFNAAEGDKEIKLRWEDGYMETYTLKFSEAVKLENLENAVAAKALAFNAAPKKLAVGQGEQLDVKITKEQMGDVIYLGYESSDPETLVVNEFGYVTALKLGTATITVFSQHLVNGKEEKIPNAKSATLKIQVTKLDAPKKLKATPHGTYALLNYDSPAYGYRREIYVVEKTGSSPKSASDFERILNGMKENQWQEKGFAIAPIYISKSTEDSWRNSEGYVRSLSGLDIKKDYTIYVRNVCAVRTLTSWYGDGVVTQAAMNESAAGAVVNVKTKKAEVADLYLNFYNPETKTYYYDYDLYGKGVKFSELKNGTLECSVAGAFPEVLDSGKLLTNQNGVTDKISINLPFGKEDKAAYKDVYEEPKLEYALSDCYDKKTGTSGWGIKNDYASIDKKGKIKITGFSWDSFDVRVRDTVTGEEAVTSLYVIPEEADSVKAAKSSVTLSVGQYVYLSDLLTYNLGKVKLTAYPIRSIDLDKVRDAIKSQNQEKNFTVSEYGQLTAINGGGKLTLELTDKNVEKKSGTDKATAKVTITSKDLESVKNLKAYDVTHDNFGLTYKYSGGATQFLLEVSDAKKPIYSKVIGRGNSVLALGKDGRYIPIYDGYGYFDRWATVKDTYMISNIKGLGINLYKDSQYTVSLTPIYGEVKAKPATAKVKTTKIPARDTYLHDNSYKTGGEKDRGGMPIIVSESNRNLNLGNSKTYLNAVSGDTYTLTASGLYNRGRVNDTLTWTVGDAKVATVKAAAGTYCITLKGMKPGDTTLEVRSKIMGNKVIARYDIHVSAVQDAYSYNSNGNDDHRYYGENEPN